MRLRPFRLVPALVGVLLLVAPAIASAQDVTQQDIAINSIWVVVAAILVLFMQAGFAMLEVGLSRMKNAGAVMGKILINLSISFLMFWAVGFAIGFGTGNDFLGSSGWFMDNNNPAVDYASLAYSNTNFEAHLLLPGRLLRGVAGDRLRRDARPHEVHRLRDLRHRVRRLHLPDRRPLDVGRRLAAAGRLPGLRRLVDRAPAGRAGGRSPGRSCWARASASSGTGSPFRSPATRCRS